jgi:hypothetical protein
MVSMKVPYGSILGFLWIFISIVYYSFQTYHRKTPLGNQEYGNGILLKWVLEKQNYVVSCGLIWLRIETSNGYL